MAEQDQIRVVTPGDRKPGPSTPGMDRQEAFATDGMWSGIVRTEVGMVSGWHHHGGYETTIYVLTGALKMEFGPDGSARPQPRETVLLMGRALASRHNQHLVGASCANPTVDVHSFHARFDLSRRWPAAARRL